MSRYQCQICGCYAHARSAEQAARLMRPQCATFDEHTTRALLADSYGPGGMRQSQLEVGS